MNRKIILTVIVLVFFITWFNSAPIYTSFNKTPDNYSKSVVANSRTIWVPGDYPTIQEAINAAKEGDTVFVRAGTYYEHVVVNKTVSVMGENRSTTIIDGSGSGTVVYIMTNNFALSNFTIQNGELGIWFWYSSNNTITGNTFSNNSYGIFLSSSNNNLFTCNVASNNHYGIYLWSSSNNTFTGNTFSNNSYGIYLDGSSHNILTGNAVSSNNDDGILLYHSGNNLFTCNVASNNHYGINIRDSDSNILTGNTFSNNSYGTYLSYSRDNILTCNVASNNHYGIYLSFSSSNVIFHNNFINNTEPPSSIGSLNSWDNSAEGNYWSDYDGTDPNWDGIGDTQYPIDENNQDNYPLMAMFLQFNITTENQSYKIGAVCNSTISNFQYSSLNRTNTLSFKVNATKGKSFCRICIPNALIEPPHTVTINYNQSLYFKTVYTNRTHTWLYLTYAPSEHEVTIMHMPYPEQLVLSQWAILGLTVITVILLLISIKYYRMFNKQKKVIQAYEHELGSFPVSHPERARTRFIKDIVERKEKIEEFEKKYGIKIKTAKTFEDLIKKLGVEKEVKN